MRVLCVLLTLFLITSFVHAEEGPYFDVKVIASLGDPEMDYWYRIPLNSGPNIPMTNKVYQYQPFQLLMFCRAEAVNSQKVLNIVFDFKIVSSDGTVVAEAKKMPYYFGKLRDALILPDKVLDMMFEDEKPGQYNITVDFRETVSKRKYSTTIKVELLKFKRPESFKSKQEFSSWLMKYYRKPDPIRCLAGIMQYLETDKGKYEENVTIIAFSSRVLKDNPFIWKYYAELYTAASPEEKDRLLYAAAFVDSEEKKKVFEPKIDMVKRPLYRSMQKLSLPSTKKKLTSPVQLDILWSEFLATGKYAPIRRLVDSLELRKYSGTLDDIKSGKIKDLTAEVEAKAILDATYQSAMWSLISNGVQHPLVYKYCITINEKETLDKDIKKNLKFILYGIGKTLEERKEAAISGAGLTKKPKK